ncbi:MAG: nucleotidyl transferase AbiEii/AbiGii toxin family protein [Candidatus Cloacimonetes bacterium]|nr:nucleotidyl transferase AbiEii/AbiGii toxin family protein [Candidatus Cloacimonadota bacterium]
MIAQRQIAELASLYNIDSFTIFREYLQLSFLNYLCQEAEASKIYFKGGTAIHLLFNSPRFSQDLDFSTEYAQGRINELVKKIEKNLVKELPEFKILPLHQGKESVRFKVKFIQLDFKYPFLIQLDFTKKDKPMKKPASSSLVTKFPITFFPIIIHLQEEEILAEKIRALLMRAKGRDIFDLWFLLEKEVPLDIDLVNKKLRKVKSNLTRGNLLRK